MARECLRLSEHSGQTSDVSTHRQADFPRLIVLGLVQKQRRQKYFSDDTLKLGATGPSARGRAEIRAVTWQQREVQRALGGCGCQCC